MLRRSFLKSSLSLLTAPFAFLGLKRASAEPRPIKNLLKEAFDEVQRERAAAEPVHGYSINNSGHLAVYHGIIKNKVFRDIKSVHVCEGAQLVQCVLYPKNGKSIDYTGRDRGVDYCVIIKEGCLPLAIMRHAKDRMEMQPSLDFRELARKSPPPQEWFDSEFDPFV